MELHISELAVTKHAILSRPSSTVLSKFGAPERINYAGKLPSSSLIQFSKKLHSRSHFAVQYTEENRSHSRFPEVYMTVRKGECMN